MGWSWLFILLIIVVARQQSLAGGSARRQGCLDYKILKVPKVAKWQNVLWKFWKPKDKPYGKLVLPEVKSIHCHWIRNNPSGCRGRQGNLMKMKPGRWPV